MGIFSFITETKSIKDVVKSMVFTTMNEDTTGNGIQRTKQYFRKSPFQIDLMFKVWHNNFNLNARCHVNIRSALKTRMIALIQKPTVSTSMTLARFQWTIILINVSHEYKFYLAIIFTEKVLTRSDQNLCAYKNILQFTFKTSKSNINLTVKRYMIISREDRSRS